MRLRMKAMVGALDLRKIWIFEGLSDAEVELVSSVVEYRHCPVETTVCEAGTSDRSLFVVYSGSVRIVKKEASGGESPIAEVLPGHHFGEVSFVDGGVRSATAVTNEPTARRTTARISSRFSSTTARAGARGSRASRSRNTARGSRWRSGPSSTAPNSCSPSA